MATNPTTNAAQPKSRRRCFQYGLRSLLIAVTLVGALFCWVGSQANLVRERSALRAAWRERGVLIGGDYDPSPAVPGDRPKISWIRRALGDQAVSLIEIFNEGVTDQDIAQIMSAFPEAYVLRSHRGVMVRVLPPGLAEQPLEYSDAVNPRQAAHDATPTLTKSP